MRRLLHKAYYDFFFYTGISKNILNKQQKNRKVILTYHNVLPSTEIGPYYTNFVDVSKDVFQFHIKTLLKNFNIQPASKILNPSCNGIFLSFDDGMSNNMDIVHPILSRNGITAMFAVCSGLLNGEIDFIWRDQIFLLLQNLMNKKIFFPELSTNSSSEISSTNLNQVALELTNFIQTNKKMDIVYQYLEEIKAINNIRIEKNQVNRSRYLPMSLDEVKLLSKLGHFVVSHTHTHRKLSMLSADQILFELKTSKTFLSQNISECNTIVYPYGTSAEVNGIVRGLTKETGYEYAFMNCNNNIKNDLSIPRISMGNLNSKEKFFGVLSGLNKIFQ